jgi:hypothetical protein
MPEVILCNAFSLNMLAGSCLLQVSEISLDGAHLLVLAWEDANFEGKLVFTNAVGHPDTASLLSKLIGVRVAPQRATVTLLPNTKLLVAQYSGPRLPEGATSLPEGASLKFFLVSLA